MKKIFKLLLSKVQWFYLKSKRVQLGSGFIGKGKPYVINRGRIILGDGIKMNSGLWTNPIGGDSRLILSAASRDAEIRIGARSGLSNCTIFAIGKITIGEDCMIGGGTKIYDTDFHPLDPDQRKFGPNTKTSKSVFIGNNVFIGGHAIILKGTRIGDNSVIGAGAVVSGTVPANEIWAGNPARKVRDIT